MLTTRGDPYAVAYGTLRYNATEVSSMRQLISRRALPLEIAWLCLPALSGAVARPARSRVAVFRAEVTTPLGEPNIGNVPATKVDDALWAKGIVLDDGRTRYVICAMDWCTLGNDAELIFRTRLAQAAGTDPSQVALQMVHQHAAPSVSTLEEEGTRDPKRLRFSRHALEEIASRVAAAVKASIGKLEPFDRIGTGQAKVDRVASARRILTPDGRVLTRWSTSGKDPAMAAAPEGIIDPMLKTITLARGERPLVRLHYYATHPQTFCCDGRVSADFVGWARETLERREKVFQIYFTGCAGNVTVGKYNDESPEAREALGKRLLAGMSASVDATRFSRASALVWRTVALTMPPRANVAAKSPAPPAPRTRPFALSALEIGNISILHLPGEPALEFQLYAQRFRPGRFVAVAECGDSGTGYICTDQMVREGGYEPGASRVGPGAEDKLKTAIRQLLGEQP
ncbi:MAG TPA: hypothetical protein VN442_12390 [Bryobacteraceae bacterium]|nr:hypothetical protein [Bryobacteraceae bacterium]